MTKWKNIKPWYHGSPFRLTTIRKGSTITQDRDLARIFSHKPKRVSISDDGKIKHDGTTPGFLYCIAKKIQPGDVVPHPRSSMKEGKEWLTNRTLRVMLLGPTRVTESERLTAEEIIRLTAQVRNNACPV